MNFENRIKKEMTEGIVKAIFEDAGYRVIESGIEKLMPEVSCLSHDEYRNLAYPDAMKHLPDFTVMDREQKTKTLVEVKYRSTWSKDLLLEVEEKAKIYKELVLVSVNANPPADWSKCLPSQYLRCCALRYVDGLYQVELSAQDTMSRQAERSFYWVGIEEIANDPCLWWRMSPLQSKFKNLQARKDSGTIFAAVRALTGILNRNGEHGSVQPTSHPVIWPKKTFATLRVDPTPVLQGV